MRIRQISSVRPITASTKPLLGGPSVPAAVLNAADKLVKKRASSQVQRPETVVGPADPPRAPLLAAIQEADAQGCLADPEIRATAVQIGLALLSHAPVGKELRERFGPDAARVLSLIAEAVPAVGQLAEWVTGEEDIHGSHGGRKCGDRTLSGL